MISERQRLEYLEVMGIQPWISRERANDLAELQQVDPAPQIANAAVQQETAPAHQQTAVTDQNHPLTYEIGPGSGQTLFLCARREDAASLLASDIARGLGEAPVWGWQSRQRAGTSAKESESELEQAIKDRLFTRVLVFGSYRDSGKVGTDEVLSSARVIYAPPMSVLANDADGKRRLWAQLTALGWSAKKSA